MTMTIDVYDDALEQVVARDRALEKVAGGFGFTEGPVWHPHERWLLFSDIARSAQYRWSETDGLSPFRLPSNQANGNAFDREGRVVSCEHASSALVRHEHDGKLVRVLADRCEGRALNSPNDVVVDRRGRIWFTDPTFGRIREDLGILRDPELDFRAVFRFDPDGRLTVAADDFEQPNGLCFTGDESRLLVNDSWRDHIRVFAVADDGALSGGEVFAEIVGDGEGVPDGMKVDVEDRVFCNGPGGVHVLSREGAPLGRIRTPEKSTNFTFGCDDLGDLFVTASTSVYRIRTRTRGAPAF